MLKKSRLRSVLLAAGAILLLAAGSACADCEHVDFYNPIAGETLQLSGDLFCELDLYLTYGSADFTEWTYLGTFQLDNEGFCDSGVIAEPGASYAANEMLTTNAVGSITICDCAEFLTLVPDQSLFVNGTPNCHFDLYASNGSTVPADWTLLGESYLLNASGLIDTLTTALPGEEYIATVAETNSILGQATVPSPSIDPPVYLDSSDDVCFIRTSAGSFPDLFSKMWLLLKQL